MRRRCCHTRKCRHDSRKGEATEKYYFCRREKKHIRDANHRCGSIEKEDGVSRDRNGLLEGSLRILVVAKGRRDYRIEQSADHMNVVTHCLEIGETVSRAHISHNEHVLETALLLSLHAYKQHLQGVPSKDPVSDSSKTWSTHPREWRLANGLKT